MMIQCKFLPVKWRLTSEEAKSVGIQLILDREEKKRAGDGHIGYDCVAAKSAERKLRSRMRNVTQENPCDWSVKISDYKPSTRCAFL
jgi:hypothetical protein